MVWLRHVASFQDGGLDDSGLPFRARAQGLGV